MIYILYFCNSFLSLREKLAFFSNYIFVTVTVVNKVWKCFPNILALFSLWKWVGMVNLPDHGCQLSVEMLVSYWWLASDHAPWHWKPKSTLRGSTFAFLLPVVAHCCVKGCSKLLLWLICSWKKNLSSTNLYLSSTSTLLPDLTEHEVMESGSCSQLLLVMFPVHALPCPEQHSEDMSCLAVCSQGLSWAAQGCLCWPFWG